MAENKITTAFTLTPENKAFVEREAERQGINRSAYVSLLISEARHKAEQREELHKLAMSSK